MTKTIQSRSMASLHESEKDLSIIKRVEKKIKILRNIDILKKLSIISISMVLLSFIVISIFNIHSMKTTGLNPAINIGINKLKNDMAFFANRLSTEYGQLRLIDGDLVGQEGDSLKDNYKLIDEISSNFGVAVTVLARNGDDYRRISTSIVDNTGKRAVDTVLETDNAAYPYIQDGKGYTGKVVIQSKNFLSEFSPIFAENGNEAIGFLVVGKDMTTIEEAINTNIVKYIKRMTIITFAMLLASVVLFRFFFVPFVSCLSRKILKFSGKK